MTLHYVISLETQREILSCLTLREAWIVEARWLGGMTHREIAQKIGVSPMSVTNWLRSAQKNVLESMPELEAEAAQRTIRTRTKKDDPDPWGWLKCGTD